MERKSHMTPMVIIGVLFFLFGFVTWLNGSLIPFLTIICDLDTFEAFFVTFAFYIAYTVMALPMSYVLEKYGYKKGMEIGLRVMAIGSLLFIPAALSGEFLVFLSALFTLGTGLTILQTASNPYIVLLGPKESAAKRISIMGIINKTAGVLAPLVFTVLIFSDMPSTQNLTPYAMDELAFKLVEPYLVMTALLFSLVFFVKYSSLPEITFVDDEYDDSSLFDFPHLILGAIALFFYVGVEVIAGDSIGLYAQSLGVENATALTSYTMGFMVLGYLVGIVAIPKVLSQKNALVMSALLGIIFTLGIVYSDTQSYKISEILWGWSGLTLLPDSVVFVALLGFANALVWPSIWPLALDNLGKHTARGSALLIMAIAGGAVLPVAFGKLSEVLHSMQDAYALAFGCYLFILMYALRWHKIKSWSDR